MKKRWRRIGGDSWTNTLQGGQVVQLYPCDVDGQQIWAYTIQNDHGGLIPCPNVSAETAQEYVAECTQRYDKYGKPLVKSIQATGKIYARGYPIAFFEVLCDREKYGGRLFHYQEGENFEAEMLEFVAANMSRSPTVRVHSKFLGVQVDTWKPQQTRKED